MALTVSQYNSILRQYEEHQTRNRHLHDQRLHHIYETVPGYQALDEAVASTSVAQGKRMLAGDTNALAQLKDQLKDLAQKRASLLLENGYPTDFLDPIYDCPDCQDTGYVNGQKCHCFRQAEIALLYEQSNLKRMLEKENFDTLSYSFFQGDELTSYRQAVEKCKNFCTNFKTSYQNLFFYGTVGTGKTFLTNCIAKECIEQGCSVLYFSAASLFDLLARNTFDYRAREELSALCGSLQLRSARYRRSRHRNCHGSDALPFLYLFERTSAPAEIRYHFYQSFSGRLQKPLSGPNFFQNCQQF